MACDGSGWVIVYKKGQIAKRERCYGCYRCRAPGKRGTPPKRR